jgi:adenine-specific DNA methylase
MASRVTQALGLTLKVVGSNLFYADMALFQEGWLDGFTNVAQEAVIDRSRRSARTASRYEELLVSALSESRRVLKPGGRISMVFGNSSGAVWALVQRAIQAAGLAVVPEALAVLDKGQRSVKGLASGFEMSPRWTWSSRCGKATAIRLSYGKCRKRR